MNSDEWFDVSQERRDQEYAARAEALNLVVADVRAHRAESCEGAPMCPGADAGNKVNSVPQHQIGEFIMTCLAGLADRDERFEALARQIAETADRHTAQVAFLERELAAAKREGDAGWAAYREAEDERRELVRAAARASLPRRTGSEGV